MEGTMVDSITKEYRENQLGKISGENEYARTLKLVSACGETKWMGISEEELAKIKAILLGGDSK